MFDFTGANECKYCGSVLGEGEDNCCSTNDDTVCRHVFAVFSERPDPPLRAVWSTNMYKWEKVESLVEYDVYELRYLGPAKAIKTALNNGKAVEEIPTRAMPHERLDRNL